ncbi:hypothetical protein SO802_009671, partial [Lithocarpus litseifolius]
ENIKRYQVLSEVEPNYLRKHLPESAPYFLESIETILQDVQEYILPGITHWQSPNYFAYLPSSGSIAGSDQTHSAIQKAAKIAGINPMNFRAVKTTKSASFGLCPKSLRDAVQANGQAGLVPFFLCATVGTTSTNAIDPIQPLCEVAKDYSIWVHVDAAYAGSACICP